MLVKCPVFDIGGHLKHIKQYFEVFFIPRAQVLAITGAIRIIAFQGQKDTNSSKYNRFPLSCEYFNKWVFNSFNWAAVGYEKKNGNNVCRVRLEVIR